MIKIKLLIVVFVFPLLLLGQNGTVKTYYLSGKVESRTSFVDDILEGKAIWYYENGNKRSEKNYSNGKLNGVSREFYKSGLVKKEVNISNGILNGISKSYYENGGLKEVLEYDMGKLISQKKIDYDTNYIPPLKAYEAGKKKRNFDNNDFLCEIDICPEPIGGLEEIESNIIYPALARQYRLEGSVLITAKINQRGIPESVKVIKGLGLGCDEAAVEAVKKTKFIPGELNGEIVATDVTFKLNFKIKEPKEPNNYIASKKSFEGNLKKGQGKDNTNLKTTRFISCDLDKCPEPIGGITELLKKLRYPPQAKRNKISGDVLLEVTVDEFGFVTSSKVVKGIGYGCDEAAQSAVIKTQFSPAKVDGKEVDSVIKINVPFILK